MIKYKTKRPDGPFYMIISRLGKQILVEYNNQNVFFNSRQNLNKSMFLLEDNCQKMTYSIIMGIILGIKNTGVRT